MTFVTRQIVATITLGTGDFGEGKGNTVTLSGYQMHANITKATLPTWDAAEIRIFGVSETYMNQLTLLGKPLNYPRNNLLTISAGDAQSGMSQVFRGLILTAYADFDAPPDVSLVLSAAVNPVAAAQSVPPISYPGPVSAAVIASQIAAQMNIGFVNSGVNVMLPKAYFDGSSIDQLNALKEKANCNAIPTGGSAGNSLEIWPKGTARGAMGPLIAPPNLVNYPKYSDAGAMLQSIYMPGMGIGQLFTLQSSLKSAVGTWMVKSLNYELECLNPTGNNEWFMNIEAMRKDLLA